MQREEALQTPLFEQADFDPRQAAHPRRVKTGWQMLTGLPILDTNSGTGFLGSVTAPLGPVTKWSLLRDRLVRGPVKTRCQPELPRWRSSRQGGYR